MAVDIRKPCHSIICAFGPMRLGIMAAVIVAACGGSPDSMVSSAKEYLSKRDLNSASIELKNALQKNPELGEARFLLGKVYFEQGDFSGAVINFQRALDSGFKTDELQGVLSRALLATGESETLLKQLDGVSLTDPVQNAYLQANLADARLLKGQRDEAEKLYQAALASDPNNIRARTGVARLKALGGDIPGTKAELDQALGQPASPDQAEAYTLKASVLINEGKADEAISALEGAVKAKPSLVATHFSLISFLLRKGKTDQAKERLAGMKNAVGNHPLTLYLQAFMNFREGRVKEAKDEAEKVIRAAPEFLPGRLLAGSIYLRLDEHQQAQANLQKVLEKVPGQPLARRMMVASLLATKEPDRAEDVLKPLLEAGKNDPAVMGLAGQLYLAKGDFDRSSDYFDRATKLDPNNADARTRLGVAKLASGEAQEAFADLEAASQLDDGSVRADVALIMAHLRRGEIDKALAAQATLEKKQPTNPQTYNLKGGVLMAKKDLAGARAAFEKALSLEPTFLPAVSNLVRIDLFEKQPGEAKKRFENVIAKDPKMAQAYLGLAEIQAATGSKPEEVEATLKQGMAANSAAVSPKLALTRFYLQTKEPKRALSLAQEIEAGAPDNPAAVELLARSQIAAGELQQGLTSLNKLVGLQPKAPAPLVELAEAQALAKDFSGAERSLKKALEVKPDFIPAQQRLIALYLRDKREDAALATARTVQKQQSDAAIGYALEGDIRSSAKKWPEAVSAYKKSYQLGKTPTLLIKLHAALLRTGASSEADRLSADWIRTQPNDVAVRSYLAERALTNGKTAEAINIYEGILKINPNNALVLNNLAYAAGEASDPRAMGYAESALKLAPNNPAILDTYGVLLVKKGETAKGLEVLEQAKAAAPKALPIRLHLANAYIKADRKSDAKRELELVIGEVTTDQPAIREKAETMLKSL
ncbi:MAG: PEP-CTERM system TPR-repeat protein PrsT [Zoogloeaceae bacterium]|nr:PEP-CTERM system TPR-repeat protein PrsT [Zoogloeaceae bacterium]